MVMEQSAEGLVNLPYGLQSEYFYDASHRLMYNYDADSRPFFVPPGYMRIGLEEHRIRCCPPGLYDLEPHEKFQAVQMRFCAPNTDMGSNVVVDVPTGDFTEAVLIRQPTRDIYEMQLIVQARITAMKKFAMANSSNPGAVVYMIIRNEVVQNLQSLEAPQTLSSKRVLNALNEKTASIGLSIRSVFVDTVTYDHKFRSNRGPPKRFPAYTGPAAKSVHSDGPVATPLEDVDPVVNLRTDIPPLRLAKLHHMNRNDLQTDKSMSGLSSDIAPSVILQAGSPASADVLKPQITSPMVPTDVNETKSQVESCDNIPVVDTTPPPMMLGRKYNSYSASDSDDITGTFESNRFRPRRRESSLLARMATAAQTSLFPGKAATKDSGREHLSSSSSSASTWSLCNCEARDEDEDAYLSESNNDDDDDDVAKEQS